MACDDETGYHYNLPGGGVEVGESVRDALAREVREETAAAVSVGDLVFVHEYFPPAHDGAYGPTHKLALWFTCDLADGATPTLPERPDPDQVGVEWLPVESLPDQPLLPDLGDRWRDIATASPSREVFGDG